MACNAAVERMKANCPPNPNMGFIGGYNCQGAQNDVQQYCY
jgi:hypothetical protein